MNQPLLRAWLAVSARIRECRETADERGLTTTEIAVLTFVLVAIAAIIGSLLLGYAEGQVDNLPDEAPTIQLDDG